MPICVMCHEDKPASEFAFRSLATGQLQSHCRKCHAAYRRQHYLDNRDAYIAREVARIKRFREANRVLLYEYLSTHACVDCGEADVLVLEFDHRDPSTKRGDIGLIAARKPWKFVIAEIEKCDVRCANCHRKRTAVQFNWKKPAGTVAPASELASDVAPERERPSPLLAASIELRMCTRCLTLRPLTDFSVKNKSTGRRSTICRLCLAAYGREHYRRNTARYVERGRENKKGYRRQNRARVLEYLAGKSCVDCGETNPTVLDFDHRDRTQKRDVISRIVGSGQWSSVAEEIAKCDVRCANCHRRRTAEQFGWTKRALQLAAGRSAPERLAR